ncbi:hypothetical protein KR50_11110 [Jeotgalibacillus campisalis]|uniref:Uncharacterized protein n=1 Tax=Jeotgalibacillus campisalis TaxID=220754 RepID=A0A0C2VXE0_9BACL|nr:hypothetical protein KR50_11110 [Jeotgalibacillus campisalis]
MHKAHSLTNKAHVTCLLFIKADAKMLEENGAETKVSQPL